ncbi:Autophagy-related protein 18b [Linum grandiflorum]
MSWNYFQIAVGAFVIVEMLYSSSLLAIVGAGEQPSLSPRRLCLFNTTTGTALRELNFLTSILAVRLNKKRWLAFLEAIEVCFGLEPVHRLFKDVCFTHCRLVVVLQEKTFVYDSNSLTILDTVVTVPNPKGLCAFSPNVDGCFLALPASTTKGSVFLYNVMEVHVHCEIDAHRAPLAAVSLSSNGTYIATASEQGTIIRVHHVLEATKSYSFRRGTYPSTVYSLSFGPSLQLPEILVATSSSGSVHAFSLSMAVNQRGRRSTSFLGSMLPDSVNDALDPAHHHVLHTAVPAGVKRATFAVINYNGYFQEYILDVNSQSESKWSLEREFNLLAAVSASEEQHFQLI